MPAKCQLEELNFALSANVEAQQLQLRDGFTERENKIRMLNEALSRTLAQTPASPESTSDDARAAREALTDLDRRLSREITSRQRLERRLQSATLTASKQNVLSAICAISAKGYVANWRCSKPNSMTGLRKIIIPARPNSAAPRVLYVGGRAHQVPQLRAAVERAGGALLYHDGGIDHQPS